MRVSSTHLIGGAKEPVVIIDGFVEDPDQLRRAASDASFGTAGQHYPGIRAPLPADYLKAQLPLIGNLLTTHFGHCRRIRVVDVSFSIVTARPDDLRVGQRLPHVDAYGRERIALIHYLATENTDGTAFFRHRSTGFEYIDAERAAAYYSSLERELESGDGPIASYINGDTNLFERTYAVPARYNRALLYRSYLLHSGAISPDASLDADPMRGRLTVTGFFSVE